MKTLKISVAALMLVAFTGTSLFAQQKGKTDEKKASTSKGDKKDDKKKNMAVKGEGVPSKTKTTAPAKSGAATTTEKK
jgi:hypothetical protein